MKLLPEAIGLLNENSSARGGLPPYELLVKEAFEAPRATQQLPLPLVAHQNLMITDALVTG